jgi:CheY-like chemotaxis protein
VQKKILIVEDEYDIASTMTLVLEMENYEVRHCYNGLEALEILSSEALPDLIVSDVMMPLLDGYGFAHALRAVKRYDHIPLILTSAGRLDDKKLNPSFLQGFVRKPFDLYDFLEVVKNSLKK